MSVARGRARIDSSQLAEPAFEEVAFDLVLGEQEGFGVGEAGVAGAVQAAQELAARGGEVVVAGQLRFGTEFVQGVQPGLGPVGLTERRG